MNEEMLLDCMHLWQLNITMIKENIRVKHYVLKDATLLSVWYII